MQMFLRFLGMVFVVASIINHSNTYELLIGFMFFWSAYHEAR